MKSAGKNINHPEEVKSVLITRTDRLGDVILTLPLVSYASGIFEKAEILFLVKKYVGDVVCNYEGIDEVIFYDELGTFSSKYKYFKNKKIDLVIFAKPEFELALIFFLLRVRYRIGTGYRWYSFLFNLKVYEHRKTSDKHESEYNLNLMRNYVDGSNITNQFHFLFTEDEKKNLNEKLGHKKIDPGDSYIIIHPGSGNSAKDLPVETLSRFSKEFIRMYPDYKLLITGTKSERDLTKTFFANGSGNIIDLTGELNLRELMILIDHCRLFISNSTGPIHLAGALNKNIIGFYPNSKPMNKERWKPLSDNQVILTPSDNNDNMRDITAEKIMEAAKEMLQNLK